MESERRVKVEHLQQASDQLQCANSDKEEERKLIRQQLEEVELELRKALDENSRLLIEHSAQSEQQ